MLDKMDSLAAVLALVLLAMPRSDAFQVPSRNGSIKSGRTIHNILRIGLDHHHHHSVVVVGFQHSARSNRIRSLAANANAKNNEDGDNDELKIGPGMEDAFKELEALQSLGDGKLPKRPKKGGKDEAFAEAIEGLDLKAILSQAETDTGGESASSPESELDLYKDMASELDVASSDEDLIAADFKSDLELSVSSEAGVPVVDTQDFMDRAIKEALLEAKEKDSNVDVNEQKEAFLDNKEIMSEIEKIFDKANEDLVAEIEDIRLEQATLAKEQAERNSRASLEKIEDTERRMEVAQGNMKKMLTKVNAETKAVEDAIEDLKQAQADSEGGIDTQLVGLKSGGLVKQAALAGALLFTFRGGAEAITFLAGDPSHALPALIQGALAIACIVGFVFL